MFEATAEPKVFRDPVHGYIRVDLKVVWECINSSWFQRLRRIRQLGGASMVYHCAEHTRFSHSLGVYEIVRRMVSEVADIRDSLSTEEKVIVMLAGLLHDIGHGPYSHSLEGVTGISHEVYTCRIIEEDTDVHAILERHKPGLSKEVADVIRHTSRHPLLSQLVSSQLDADRMDYLLRDAYFTGTSYGQYDLERILRTLRVHDGETIVVKKSGVYAVENYIMARYHMYWQVYYHPVARSFECLLHALFRRVKEVRDCELFSPLWQGMSLHDYFVLDEAYCSYGFGMLAKSGKDAVEKDLAERIMDRRLFACEDIEQEKTVREAVCRAGLDPAYYVLQDAVSKHPYEPYGGMDEMIHVRMKDGAVKELSEASALVGSIIHADSDDDRRVFFPKGILPYENGF